VPALVATKSRLFIYLPALMQPRVKKQIACIGNLISAMEAAIDANKIVAVPARPLPN
jgi:hypothetical protein